MKKYVPIALCILAVICGVIYFSTRTQSQDSNLNVQIKNNEKDDLIVVDFDALHTVLVSPLVITGKARGNWFFEASFPVVLLDGNNQEIAHGVAHAKTDWMTTEFVPFEVTLTFIKPTTSTGTLRFKKDNPSGDPVRDDSLDIKVRF